ncbi:cytochrome P450 CYP147 [Parafrankia sp. EAN1pec]|nr:cytochrome P450 CYP147 [Frankia sp. EAN1pec]
MAELAAKRHDAPRDHMLSGLVSDDGPQGRMSQAEPITTAILLFVAGHETTVDLITDGMLIFLRHPELLEWMRREPDLMAGAVEELLRYEPPVHMLPQRTTLTDVEIAGTTIPRALRSP